MGTKKEIWQKIDRRTGLTEPDEAYFEQFASRIMEQLPEMEQPKAQPVSLWTRLQPWIYMAAMFAGIALMVRIFSPSQPSTETDIVVAEEHLSNEYYDELIWASCVDDYSVYEYFADAYEY